MSMLNVRVGHGLPCLVARDLPLPPHVVRARAMRYHGTEPGCRLVPPISAG